MSKRTTRYTSTDTDDDVIPLTPPPTCHKRPNPSTTPPREPRAFISSDCPLNTPPKTPKKAKTHTGPRNLDFMSSPGIWTADKKEAFIDRLIALGLKSTNADSLALEFNMSKQQIKNSVQAGKPGNLRDKSCKGVRGD